MEEKKHHSSITVVPLLRYLLMPLARVGRISIRIRNDDSEPTSPLQDIWSCISMLIYLDYYGDPLRYMERVPGPSHFINTGILDTQPVNSIRTLLEYTDSL